MAWSTIRHDAAKGRLTGVVSNVEVEMVTKDYEELSKDDFPGLLLI